MKVYLAICIIKEALKNAFIAMENQVNLETTFFIWRSQWKCMASIILETIEKLINMIYHMHNKTMWNENLCVGKLKYWYPWY